MVALGSRSGRRPSTGKKRTSKAWQGLRQNSLLINFATLVTDDSAMETVAQKLYADAWNKHDKSVIPSLPQSGLDSLER